MAFDASPGAPLPPPLLPGAGPHASEPQEAKLTARLGRNEYVAPDRLPAHPASRVVGALRGLWRAHSMGELAGLMGALGLGRRRKGRGYWLVKGELELLCS
jgi:hypothetical protein